MPLPLDKQGLQIPFGIQPVNAVPVDTWSGPYSGVDETAALALANSSIDSAIRFRTMEVRILIGPTGSQQAYKYWYRDGTLDVNLVRFELGATGATGAQVAIFDSSDALVTSGATGLKFTGTGVSLTNSGDYVTVDIQGATGSKGETGPNVAIYDPSGSILTSGATGIQFQGSGVSVTGNGAFITVEVTGATGATGQSVAIFGSDGTLFTSGATGIKFEGTGITINNVGDFVVIGVSGGGAIETTAPLTGDGTPGSAVTLQYTNDFGLTADKLALNLDFSPLVTPLIVSNWNVWKYGQYQTTPMDVYTIANYTPGTSPTLTGNVVQVPKGVLVDFGGTASCPVPSAGQSLPTSTSGDWTWTPNDPPVAGQENLLSELNLNSDYSNATVSYSTTFGAPNSGLIVQNSRVVRAEGDQSTSASVQIVFKDVFYWGYSGYWSANNNLSPSAVTGLSESGMAGIIDNLITPTYLFGTKSQTLSGVDDYSGVRLVLAYPAALGDLSSVKFNGVLEIINAFIEYSSFQFTTISGATAAYKAYVAVSDNGYGGVNVITQ
jgi:hypothetical protein